ncbi:hypothetical protein [Sphingomonas beigongshangi]|jgi:hypothetical protein|uniref:hypothetical protein n=1 Tax=Sphingomonas beigongshangi TaxID=2782540 RepID=UPI001AEF35E0|nr:hypothetical protein [Sphingomonas beigongshangi]
MAYDSRRWTGRYARGEMPPEFAGGRPYRSRHLRWWLLAAVVLCVGVAVGELWMPPGHGSGLPIGWFVALATMNAPMGRSPFARRRRYEGMLDEFERQAMAVATQRAYVCAVVLGAAAMGWCAVATAYALPMPSRWGDCAVWALTLAAVASNLPTLFAEFAIPLPSDENVA